MYSHEKWGYGLIAVVMLALTVWMLVSSFQAMNATTA